MFLFRKKKKETKPLLFRKDHPEVIAAQKFLEETHPTLIPRRDFNVLCGREPFNYIKSSRNGSFVRHHFCEGVDTRIIYIALSPEEREKVIQTFKEKLGDDNVEFIYKDSLKGMFIGNEVKHRFFINDRVAFMSDNGEVEFPKVLQEVDF